MAKQQVRISNLIIPKFLDDFNSKMPRQIDEGGRGSTKTSKNSIKVAFTSLSEKDCSAVVLRRNTNKIRRSVFNEIKKGLSRLGLLEKKNYKATVSPFQITVKKTNNKIYFTGIESIDDIKGMVDPDRPIKLVWIEELTEFFDKSLEEGEELIDNIEATFSRGNNDWFVMLFSFNPPRNPNHPVMQWLNKMKKRNDVIHTHSTYLDVPQEWLGKAFIRQAEALKQSDEELYRHIYLGECVGTRGRIYKIKDEYLVTADVENNDYYDFYTMAVDIGLSKSATTFCLTGYSYIYENSERKLTAKVLEEYWHRNADHREIDQKEYKDYASDFIQFYKMCVNKYKRVPLEIRSDHDIMFLKELKRQFQQNKLNFSLVKKAIKYEINDRIQALKVMMSLGLLKFDKDKVPITIQAFKDALWNEDKANKGIDERLDDLTTNIDSLDCCEYSLEPFFCEMIRFEKSGVK